jgi:hypothetical protein
MKNPNSPGHGNDAAWTARTNRLPALLPSLPTQLGKPSGNLRVSHNSHGLNYDYILKSKYNTEDISNVENKRTF